MFGLDRVGFKMGRIEFGSIWVSLGQFGLIRVGWNRVSSGQFGSIRVSSGQYVFFLEPDRVFGSGRVWSEPITTRSGFDPDPNPKFIGSGRVGSGKMPTPTPRYGAPWTAAATTLPIEFLMTTPNPAFWFETLIAASTLTLKHPFGGVA